MSKSIYENNTAENKINVENFCKEYIEFISQNKTERECVNASVELAKKAGFKDLNDYIKYNAKLIAGDKIYYEYMNKSLVLFVVGSDDIYKGINFLGAHIDSPRLDIKTNALYEDNGICYLDTHYYGGIKFYQWLALPLALHGVVVKKDGEKINFTIGENQNEPVFAISDLLPHLEKRDEHRIDKMTGEALNIILANSPDNNAKEEKIKANVLNILKEKNISEEDLFSSEIEAVPAGKAREMGLDKSLIIGYGQDDRVCAFSSLKAILECGNIKKSACCLLVDKEEIGSLGATSMASRFFENALAEILNLLGKYDELKLRRMLAESYMLSSDVTAAFDPNNPTPSNKNSDAFLGRGIAFSKFTGHGGKYSANDANPEYIAKLRNLFDSKNIIYQAGEMGNVDAGGGGTISYIMAKYAMNVIDAGVPVLNMHAPHEITCKVDIFEAYKCYKAFLNSNI